MATTGGAKRGGAKSDSGTKSGGGSADRPPAERLIEAALGLAAERAWHDIALAEIAEAAGLPLVEAYQTFPSKAALLDDFVRGVDIAVLADPTLGEDWAAEESNARDRLFDVLMLRFDALGPNRAALGNLLYDQARDPLAGLAGLCRLRRSMAAMLEAARLPSAGCRGRLRVKGLMAIYLATLRVWLRDDTSDLAKTMAALDGQLRRVEALIGRLPARPATADKGASPAL